MYPSCLGPFMELLAGSYLQSSVLFIMSFGWLMIQEEQDSSTVLLFPGKIVYPSCLRPVVELDTGSYLQSSVLFITSFGLAYAASFYSSYFPRINCVKFLFRAIIKLNAGSYLQSSVLFIISFGLAYDATIYSYYFPRINCVKFLFEAVIELNTGSIFIEWCPSIISLRLAYAPARTRFSKLGLETGLRLVSLRHYLGLLHGDFCLRQNLLQ